MSVTGCSTDNKQEDGAKEPSVITIDMSALFIVPYLEATQKAEDQINDYLLNTLGETDYKIHLRITAIDKIIADFQAQADEWVKVNK